MINYSKLLDTFGVAVLSTYGFQKTGKMRYVLKSEDVEVSIGLPMRRSGGNSNAISCLLGLKFLKLDKYFEDESKNCIVFPINLVYGKNAFQEWQFQNETEFTIALKDIKFNLEAAVSFLTSKSSLTTLVEDIKSDVEPRWYCLEPEYRYAILAASYMVLEQPNEALAVVDMAIERFKNSHPVKIAVLKTLKQRVHYQMTSLKN